MKPNGLRGMRLDLTLILLALCLALYASSALYSQKPLLQYLVMAPAPETVVEDGKEKLSNRPLSARLDQLATACEELLGVVSAYTVGGEAPGFDFVSDEKLTLNGVLHAVGERYFEHEPQRILFGRLLYEQELKWGGRVAVIDESTAIALYRTSQPLDRMITLDGTDYKIVGVVRAGGRVGAQSRYHVYIPMRQLLLDPIPLETLTVSALPIANTGAESAFRTGMEQWEARGNFYSMEKERVRMLLPLRILLFFSGMLLAGTLGRIWTGFLKGRFHALREQLYDHYFSSLILPAALSLLVGTLGYALLAGACFLLIAYMTLPVYFFPEWIPKILVEWQEISTTFWGIQEAASKTVSLRSHEVLQMRFFGSMIQALSAVLLFAGIRLFARRPWANRENSN